MALGISDEHTESTERVSSQTSITSTSTTSDEESPSELETGELT
ncbi:hypothetical protein CRE_20041 [Caenorhabditis remanei]|uniref:Uncharacterized protein n=1 Tax=Caenorhabditis remanei TaxID=31234 RepID=E3NHF6_CAERE|nr:hypothetical protein CRE_20041 [Caenorhabditis remanei]